MAEVIAALPKGQWKRLRIGTGTKGPRLYDWARVRVLESRDGVPGPQVWLLARRALSDPTEVTYSFALAPTTVALPQLARIASTRWTVEHVIKEAKSEVGFDRYEVRFWPSWYRHITLSMLAQVWLADQRRAAGEKKGREDLTVPEVRRLLEVALPVPERGVRERLAWSSWRRRKCYRARLCHYRHRLPASPTGIAPGPRRLAPTPSIPPDYGSSIRPSTVSVEADI